MNKWPQAEIKKHRPPGRPPIGGEWHGRLGPELDALRTLSDEYNVTQADLMRELIKQYLPHLRRRLERESH